MTEDALNTLNAPAGEAATDAFNALVSAGDFNAVLLRFDQDPAAVRRLLTRLTYAPEAPLHSSAIEAFRHLSQHRATAMPEFFTEIIRRHLWGMNDEGGNVDWSAPEIIAAVIAGCPEQFSHFIPLMHSAASAEPTFHQSLQAALKLLDENPGVPA
ncbi:MAG: hypothetical protein FWF91_07645 [Coriobacteriia bacterium]|nr:hypothetical protein [Coriobacteriia bacterium]